MAASKILADQSLNIDFVRIDGDRNDLPWQYTMEKFPSLLIFAENRLVYYFLVIIITIYVF